MVAINLVLITLTALCVSIEGCSASNGDRKGASDTSSVVTVKRPSVEDSVRVYPCRLLATFPNSLSEIAQNPRLLINGEDSCVLGILDSVAGRFISEGDSVYIGCLDRIADVSDGYVSEYLSDVLVKLFRERPAELMRYLYRHRTGDTSHLEKHLIWALRDNISYPASASLTANQIDSIVDGQTSGKALAVPEKHYLLELRVRWRRRE
jgi:hypothetical protein